jgi:hypothetical protein
MKRFAMIAWGGALLLCVALSGTLITRKVGAQVNSFPSTNNPATWTAIQTFLAGIKTSFVIANQGTPCANGNLALSGGWGTTAALTAAVGTGQTCQWTITSSGTGQATNATITWTLPNPLPAATTVCNADLVGGTGMAALSGAGLHINQTTLSATAPVFTFAGLPVAASTYFVVIRCGP